MADIKLFVCCHKWTEVPKHPLIVPIQVGAALSPVRFQGFLQDDTGDNISAKNRSYCELTAQYWAWKNVQADYYGFFHYRRYLYPDIGARCIYRIEHKPTTALLDKLEYSHFPELIQNYDMLLPKRENMYLPVRGHYAQAPFHQACDLQRMEEIIQCRYPEYTQAMEKYLSQSACYFGNIFIMKRELFERYCTWLFSVLEEFDRSAPAERAVAQERRVNGYLGERLLGIFAEQVRSELTIRMLELPRVHFDSSKLRILQRRTINLILPPGSRQRAIVKKMQL